MSDSGMTTPSGQDREGARAAMRDLPGETALGHADPATAEGDRGGLDDADATSADGGFVADPRAQEDGDPGRVSSEYQSTLPQDEVGGLRPVQEMDRFDPDAGDLSTGGEAARQAVGVDPAQSRGQVPDGSTGESTRERVVDDNGAGS